MGHRDMRGGNYAAELQPKEVYLERRRRLVERIGGGTIALWGAGDDRGYGDIGSYRQGSNFFYLSGVELPNAVIVLRPGDRGDLLFLPPRNPNVERWTGPKWGPGEEAAEVFGFDEVSRAALPPTHRMVAALRDRLPSFAVKDLSSDVEAMRVIKDEGEIALMRKAVAITVEGHRRAASVIKSGVGEGTVDGAVYAAFKGGGAEGMAFPTIVGSGYNATTLHYDQNVDTCGDGELVVVDIGARYGYYCGDLTRTYPSNGRFTDRQREIYDLVLEAHDRAAEAMRPGISVFDIRKIVYGVFEDSEVRDSQGERLGQYFIHGLGHQLGLDAHDPGAADEAPLEAGMVVTNEPGIYLPEEALGVRIENDFLITADGAENLSPELPTAADEVEEMMRAR